MDPASVASIIVALIALASAYASQRASSKAAVVAANASVSTASINARVDMETEAYQRARAFDTETIRRQAVEIDELSVEVLALRAEVRNLRHHLALATGEI